MHSVGCLVGRPVVGWFASLLLFINHISLPFVNSESNLIPPPFHQKEEKKVIRYQREHMVDREIIQNFLDRDSSKNLNGHIQCCVYHTHFESSQSASASRWNGGDFTISSFVS